MTGETYPDGTPRLVNHEDVLRCVPEPPRPLRLDELRRLVDLGFRDRALRLAAGTCLSCGLNRAGKGHADLCRDVARPAAARPQPRQPWEARPARRAA